MQSVRPPWRVHSLVSRVVVVVVVAIVVRVGCSVCVLGRMIDLESMIG